MTDDRLRLFVERVERLDEEIAGLRRDRADAFAEMKAVGYCTATVRKAIARRKMDPDTRAEGDMLLETYEAALGGLAGPAPTLAELRPDAATMAQAMLTEQVVGLEDAAQAAALAEHVVFLLDLRAEIGLLRQSETQRKAVAKAEGFEPKQLMATVRWFEKCAKHGEDAMRAGEALFGLYRATVKGAAPTASDAATDPKLAKAMDTKTGGNSRAAKALLWASSAL